jgi:hypothetical protein
MPKTIVHRILRKSLHLKPYKLQKEINSTLYRVIQEELPPLTELISDDILSKKCHINLGSIHNIYRVTFVFGNTLL